MHQPSSSACRISRGVEKQSMRARVRATPLEHALLQVTAALVVCSPR
jgi:hypothetical protein